LTELNNTLIEMAGLVERAIADSTKALITQDAALAKKVIASDDEIDQIENEIEDLCLKLILRQQPVASDLRLVSASPTTPGIFQISHYCLLISNM
jgi:phosphate transport system protein